jgi:hypothetical protein
MSGATFLAALLHVQGNAFACVAFSNSKFATHQSHIIIKISTSVTRHTNKAIESINQDFRLTCARQLTTEKSTAIWRTEPIKKSQSAPTLTFFGHHGTFDQRLTKQIFCPVPFVSNRYLG